VADPISININLFDTGKLSEEKIVGFIKEVFPLKPADIVRELNLKRPIYRKTAVFGHFGRDTFPWERLDKVDQLKKLAAN